MAKDMRTQPTFPNSIPTSRSAGFFKKRWFRAAAAGSGTRRSSHLLIWGWQVLHRTWSDDTWPCSRPYAHVRCAAFLWNTSQKPVSGAGLNLMAPLDTLTLAWVGFSELVPGQGSWHPNCIMIFGKLILARVRSIWNKFEMKLNQFWNKVETNSKHTWNTFEHSHSAFCVVQPCRGRCFQEKKNMSFVIRNLKQCFLHFTKTIFNGTRLDRRGLKS